jgi:hypothetical protein
MRVGTVALAGGALAGGAALVSAAPAAASFNQVTMLQENVKLFDPATTDQTLQTLRSMGVQMIRVQLLWSDVAANANSRTRPGGNPYATSGWAQYDNVINKAYYQYGIRVDLMPTTPGPRWAMGSGAISGFESVWNPNPSDYGAFVQAAAQRYPFIRFWELYDEPNWGPSLAPQVTSGSSTLASARMYRSLLGSAWSALQRTGHGRDTILDGSYSQDGSANLTATAISAPLQFLRQLYCVDSNYNWLRGGAAGALGCPTTKKASLQFAGNNPALFRATGVGIHPYPYGSPPTRADFPSANGVEFAEIPNMISTLGKLSKAYGVKKRLAVYNTEYGYQSRPPATASYYPDPGTVARYLNWAEFLSYKNGGVASYDQYELYDGGWFNTGLIFSRGQPKASFYSFLFPVWIPNTSGRRGRNLEVWGDVRPAPTARNLTGKAQWVYIQLNRGGGFKTVTAVKITNGRGYFDVGVKFPASGTVRLAYQYPNDPRMSAPLVPKPWIYSRLTNIGIR